jgi:hypothetical protein
MAGLIGHRCGYFCWVLNISTIKYFNSKTIGHSHSEYRDRVCTNKYLQFWYLLPKRDTAKFALSITSRESLLPSLLLTLRYTSVISIFEVEFNSRGRQCGCLHIYLTSSLLPLKSLIRGVLETHHPLIGVPNALSPLVFHESFANTKHQTPEHHNLVTKVPVI